MDPRQNNQTPYQGGQIFSPQPSADPPPGQPEPPEPFAPSSIYPDTANQSLGAQEPQQRGYSPPLLDNPLPPQTFGQAGNSQAAAKPPFFRRRPFQLAAGGAALVLLSAGTVFGWYLPNKPENVWRTGLERTGEAVEKLTTSATEEKTIKLLEKSEFTGTLAVAGEGLNYSGTFNSKYDTRRNDSNLDVKYNSEGQAEKAFGLRFMSDLAEGKDYPDIYFRFNGLKTLGVAAWMPGLDQYDGKWISVSSDYLKTLVPVDTEINKQEDFTYQDAAELAKVFTSTTQEYVFTSDEKKSVLIRKNFVGTETVEDGIKANHYVVGLNKTNAKNYCKALIERLVAAKAYKKVPGADSKTAEKDKENWIRDCQESIDRNIHETDTFDMWVDKKYKLIHKIRISDKSDKGKYWELGQSYKGGDEIPLFVRFHSDKDKYDGKLSLGINTETNVTKGAFDFEDKSEDSYTVKLTFEFKPHEGEIKIEKPADAVPVQEVLSKLGIDPSILGFLGDSTVSSGGSTKDSERKFDISALQSELEVYYAENGYYPGLKEINNSDWRDKNMVGADDDAFKDPDGSTSLLAASSSATQYGYKTSGCNSKETQCKSYTLTATLSNGSLYSKSSLGSPQIVPSTTL